MVTGTLVMHLESTMNARYGKKDRQHAEISKWMESDVEPCETTMIELETLCLEDIPPNSFLVIRVDVPGPMEKYRAATDISRAIQKYQKIFTDRNISIMVMTPKEGLEVLTEAEMNQAGWFRK